MIFFKHIYTPGESFPSRLFSYFACNYWYLDKDKKFQMLASHDQLHKLMSVVSSLTPCFFTCIDPEEENIVPNAQSSDKDFVGRCVDPN